MKQLNSIIVAALMINIFFACADTPTETGPETGLKPTFIRITSEPSGARVIYANGDSTATTPFEYTILDTGGYHSFSLRLKLDGYFPWETHFEAVPGDTLEFHVILDPVPETKIAFSSACYSSEGDTLWLAGLDAQIIDRIADNLSGWSFGWSPNHQYFSYRTAEGIVILNPDGSLYSVEPVPSGVSWSNACDRFAYGRYNDGLYIYDIATNQEEKIYDTQGLTYDHNPIFLPGDSLIAFVHHEWGILAWIRTLSVNGGTPRTVSDTIWTEHDASLGLTWVSDHEILYTGMGREYFRMDLYKLDINTGEIMPILEGGVWGVLVTDDRRYFIVNSTTGLYYGECGSWMPQLITDGFWNIRKFDFSPEDSAIIATVNDIGIYWIHLSGKVYHIFNNRDYRYLDGACFWPESILSDE